MLNRYRRNGQNLAVRLVPLLGRLLAEKVDVYLHPQRNERQSLPGGVHQTVGSPVFPKADTPDQSLKLVELRDQALPVQKICSSYAKQR